MQKYPLIGVSIIAVVLLVLGSLTNVVGYQSVKSTTVNDSPLFTTRTQRATNQHQNIITSQYLGKGIGNLLQFPIRDNRTESLIKAIEYISKMDINSIHWLLNVVIHQLQPNMKIGNINTKQITALLQQLKANSADAIIYNGIIRDINFSLSTPQSIITTFTPITCILIYILIIFLDSTDFGQMFLIAVATMLSLCHTIMCTIECKEKINMGNLRNEL